MFMSECKEYKCLFVSLLHVVLSAFHFEHPGRVPLAYQGFIVNITCVTYLHSLLFLHAHLKSCCILTNWKSATQ